MLKRIKYKNTFPSTGRTVEGDVTFEKGLGTITGPNEAGKSFILEMIRYAFFGSAALRGKAADYAKLDVTFWWDDYRVERKRTNAKLYKKDVELAVGITSVNKKIVEILGFGLDVFDVGNVANQGDLEKFGSMKPAERRRMVDSVIGLAIIDELARWAGEEAVQCVRQREALEGVLRKPEQPVKGDHRDTATIKVEITEVEPFVQEFHEISGALKHTMEPPKQPKETVNLPSENLLVFVEKERARKAKIEGLKARLSALPKVREDVSPQFLDEQEKAWDAYDRWQERVQFLRQNSHPNQPREVINEWLAKWDEIDLWEKAEKLRLQIEELEQHRVECPVCEAQFSLNSYEIEKLSLDRKRLGAPAFKPTPPPHTRHTLKGMLDQWDDWDVVADQWEAVKDNVEVHEPGLSRKEIHTLRAATASKVERDQLAQTIQALEASKPDQDWEAMYRERLSYEHGMEQYRKELIQYRSWKEATVIMQARHKELEGKPQKLAQLQGELQQASTYENQMVVYEREKKVWDESMVQIEALKVDEQEWRKVKTALTNLRGLVKQHLVPSVNKVASHLIKSMTGGQRQSIVVDEDFDVMVDGQPLNTLSGSGKAVANLALRLALGQVLTNGVMPFFAGDEIDASMDSDRAENTSETLGALRNRLSQILLVTHKCPPADYYIKLGTTPNGLEEADSAG